MKIISVIIVIWMSIAGFAGCQSYRKQDAATASPPTETVKADTSGLDKSEKITADTPILTIDAATVYWPEFLFWLNYIKKYYTRQKGMKEIVDWNVAQNGMPLSDFFLSTAVGYALKDRAIEAGAKAAGIELSEKDLAEIEKKRQNNIRIYGGRSAYLRIVRRMYVSEAVFDYLSRIDILSIHLFNHLYGEDGEKCTNEEVWAYVRSKGYICAKYIFLSNTDHMGDALSTRDRAAKRNLAKRLWHRLTASDAPLPLFDTLMNQYGEDPRILSYPDGRLIPPGRMGEVFENACLKLKESQFSNIVETGDGYYIILRMPIFPDMVMDSSGNTLRYRAAYDGLFKNQVEEWCTGMRVEYEEAYHRIDVKALFNQP